MPAVRADAAFHEHRRENTTCAIRLTVRSHASPPTVIGNADLWSACAQRRFAFDAERRPPADVGDPSLRSDGKRRAAHALQSAVAQPEATGLPAAVPIAQVGETGKRFGRGCLAGSVSVVLSCAHLAGRHGRVVSRSRTGTDRPAHAPARRAPVRVPTLAVSTCPHGMPRRQGR